MMEHKNYFKIMILFYGYREWSFEIFRNLNFDKKILVSDKNYGLIDFLKPKFIFFIGWSHIIPQNIIKEYQCICLHPSPLPKYRGGSPIQHQILNNEKESAVTFFIMNEELDGGDIIYQEEINLDGNLKDIFSKIVDVGSKGINFIINNEIVPVKQQELTEVLRRRKPEDSEITLDEIMNKDSIYLYNKIRCLQDPYPNAYLTCSDGKKIFLTEAKIEK